MLVDDAHLLDDLSALIVHQLVLQDVGQRDRHRAHRRAAPDAVTALWKDGLLGRLELQPLSRNESDDLLDTCSTARSALMRQRMWTLSRGNVLFLHHLVEHEREIGPTRDVVDGEWRWAGTPSVSPSLVELVEIQIGTVPDEVREVVDLVAIAEPIDRGVLAALTDPRWPSRPPNNAA